MTPNDDIDLQQWAGDWQAAPYDVASAENIRQYVARRGGLLRWFAVADYAVAALALPVLLYIGVTTEQEAERLAMAGLASITIVAVAFGWWNRRGVLRSSATTIADFVAISAERLRRMRTALRIGWIVLGAEVVVFSIWISNRIYSGPRSFSAGAELFSWSWLIGVTAIAAVSLVLFGRWLTRDAARFEALRRELEKN
jgi:hypothetical protein